MNISDILTSAIYSNSVATIAIIVSFIAVPASGYLSYHFAIKGEKRKEFNAVADVMRQRLRGHLEHLNEDVYPSGLSVEMSATDFDMLVDVSYAKDRKALRLLCDQYQSALNGSFKIKENGDYELISLDETRIILPKILALIERK